jgi:hypothetical protein
MPTPTYTALGNLTLGSLTSSVTFSSIPATYRDLVLVITATINFAGDADFELRLNSDFTDSNYPNVSMTGFGSGSGSSGSGNTPAITMSQNLSNHIIQIMDYSATDKHKTMLTRDNITGGRTRASAIRYASTSAITAITLTDNSGIQLNAGSTFALYGIEA